MPTRRIAVQRRAVPGVPRCSLCVESPQWSLIGGFGERHALVSRNLLHGIDRRRPPPAPKEERKPAGTVLLRRFRCRIFALDDTGEETLFRSGRSLFFTRRLGLGLTLSPLFAPVSPPVSQRDEMDPAIFKELFHRPETNACGEVKSSRSKCQCNDPCTLYVEVADQRGRYQAAHHAFKWDGMHPAQVPRQQSQRGGNKGRSQPESKPAQPGRALIPGAEPVPRKSANPEGK